MTRWQKERLSEQLKFFGAKKTKFISCYAKKPRIVCKGITSQRVSGTDARAMGHQNTYIPYLGGWCG